MSRLLLSRPFMPCCLLLAVLLRLGWVLAVDASPVDDFAWYHDRAVGIAAGDGVANHGVPTAYWPAGYPMILGALYALFGSSVRVAQAANIVLSVATVALTWLLGRRLLDSEAAGRIAALVLAVWPNQIAYMTLTATETVFSCVLMAGMLLWLRKDASPAHALLTGGMFGLATLIRPQAALLPAFAAMAWWLLDGRPRPRAGALLRGVFLHIGLGLALIPWTVRNYQVFGEVIFVANSGGINLLIGNNPKATGGYMDVPELLAEPDERGRDALAARWATQYIRSHPWEALAKVPHKLRHLYDKDVEGFYWNEVAMGKGEGAPRERPLWGLKLAAQGFWIALLAVVCVGLVRSLISGIPDPPGPAAFYSGWMVILYFTMVFMVLFGSSRFHHPMAPWLSMYAAAALAPLLRPSALRREAAVAMPRPRVTEKVLR